MSIQHNVALLEQLALDWGFTMKQECFGNIVRLTFSDNGKVGMDMELTAADSVIPFARLNQDSDAAFADFALEVLGKEFS